MMTKSKPAHVCQNCGSGFPKWAGQCLHCGAWNSLIEETIQTTRHPRHQSYAGSEPVLTQMIDVTLQAESRIESGLKELDRVLGGGLVIGSAVLIGGDPGIGKSTLLLQTLCHLSRELKVLYVTGEESLQQITLRARRLGLSEHHLLLLADTNIE